MFRGLITAIRTLTILPIPGRDSKDLSTSLYWFAIIGAFLGSTLYLIARLINSLTNNAWPQGAAVVILCVWILLTRGLHLDGLADFADAFWGAYQREKTLAIMKDSFLGTFGVLALIILLLTKWISLARLLELRQTAWIIPVLIVSRATMVELSATLPYARTDGTAGPFVKNAGKRHRLVTFIIALGLIVPVFNILGLLVIFCGWFFSRLFGFWCAHRIGGVTGDLLGACGEITEALILFALTWIFI